MSVQLRPTRAAMARGTDTRARGYSGTHGEAGTRARRYASTRARVHEYAGKHVRDYACMRGIQNAKKTHALKTTTQNVEKYVSRKLPSMSRNPETDWRQNASRSHFRIQVSFRFAWQIVEQYIKPNSTTRMRNTFQSSSFHALQVLQLKTRKNTDIRSSQA